ncbi:hypothetical protein FSP39_015669 [Pinctada imbricata]|uniref:PID domain-containing protein n=1 Tax=Pinctada imbricata TaxID=66713 RepID=A0AA88XLA7_PINIB|nr:hypothetical protein FSP39_015669 [Pinctada imbricata]
MVKLREDQLLVKKRVLYIGSSVPRETMEGLEAIQQPLRDRCPVGDDSQLQGIDAWVSVLSSGINVHYVEDSGTVIHFPITSLTLCAAVRQVRAVNGSTGEMTSRFVSLTSQQAGGNNSKNPAIFTAITRRTKGRRVLECHGFLCATDKDALDLVKLTKFADGQNKQMNTMRTQHSQVKRISSTSSTGVVITNGVNGANGVIKTETTQANGPEHSIGLTPGESIAHTREAAPEFYEPVPTSGYFYSSPNTEIKKFNVEKLGEKAASDIGPMPSARSVPRPVPVAMSARGMPPAATLVRPVPVPQPVMRPVVRRPIMVPVSAPPPRARFFSPPPMVHRQMYGPPPGPPPPMMAPPPPMMAGHPPMFMPPPPLIVRRRRRSMSDGSEKSSSRESSPKNRNDETAPKQTNGDADSESSISAYRPKTPPRDYDPPYAVPRKERMSRRDDYERRQRRGGDSPKRSPPRMMYRGYPPPYGPQAFGPYWYGSPYMSPMYARSRSMPPPNRYPTAVGKSKKHKKGKKSKKNKADRSDVVSDMGYRPDMPYHLYGPPPGVYDFGGSRRPRDFRREENQFLNERSFSHRIQEENRKSKGKPDDYPTAYELNDANFEDGPAKEGEFHLY